MSSKTDILNALSALQAQLTAVVAVAQALPEEEPAPPPPPPPTEFAVAFKPVSVLSGDIKGPESTETPIELVALAGGPIVSAQFFLDGVLTNTDGNALNGFGPWFDTTKFLNGSHVVRAVARNAEGDEAEAQVTVLFDNPEPIPEPPPPPPPLPVISGSDILIHVDARKGYSEQRGWNASGVGRYISPSQMPLRASDGSNRIAFVNDPLGGGQRCVEFILKNGDPVTSGSPRTEISCEKNIVRNRVYWVGLRVLYMDENIGDQPGLFGCQCHAGDTSKGYSPSFAIIHNKGGGNTRQFRIRTLWVAGGSSYVENPPLPIPFGRWADFVMQFKENNEGGAFYRAWLDGEQIANHSGRLGFPEAVNSYMKFGLYFWSGLTGTRRLYLMNPCLIEDPSGSKYNADAIRTFIRS